MSDQMIEPAEYINGPCPRCGAVTWIEAEQLCQPNRDETGEGTCPVADHPDDGDLVTITNPDWLVWLDTQLDSLDWSMEIDDA